MLSGNWSDTATWENAISPTDDAAVHIPENVTVTADAVESNSYATIRVDGTLRFATNVDSQIRIDTLITSQSGRLEIGTAMQPVEGHVSASIVIADRGEIDRAYDPNGLSRGVLLFGSTEIHGAEKTSWMTAAISPMAGDTRVFCPCSQLRPFRYKKFNCAIAQLSFTT